MGFILFFFVCGRDKLKVSLLSTETSAVGEGDSVMINRNKRSCFFCFDIIYLTYSFASGVSTKGQSFDWISSHISPAKLARLHCDDPEDIYYRHCENIDIRVNRFAMHFM